MDLNKTTTLPFFITTNKAFSRGTRVPDKTIFFFTFIMNRFSDICYFLLRSLDGSSLTGSL